MRFTAHGGPQVRRTGLNLNTLSRMSMGLCLGLVLSLPLVAQAAWPTRVLTGAEKDNPFDLQFGVGWEYGTQGATINREWIQDGRATEVKELEWARSSQRMVLDLRVGLFHDLELHIAAPIVFYEDTELLFATGVNDTVSTVFGNNTNANDPNYGDGAPARFPITEVPSRRERGGFGDMTFGLGWSPIVDHKDEAYPTLTLRADITAPTGSTRVPEDIGALAGGTGAGIGLGLTVFDLSVGLSKRMRIGTPYFDPYVLFGTRLPVTTGSQKNRGMQPPISGRFLVGTDLTVYEDAKTQQRYGFDVSFMTQYVSSGRFYSELSDFLPNFNQTKFRDAASPNRVDVPYAAYGDANNYAFQLEGARCGIVDNLPCGELNQVDEYLNLRGTITAHFQFAENVMLRGGFAIDHNTDHFLTNERVGEDRDDPAYDGADRDSFVGRVNAQNLDGVDERSPYFDPRYDSVGRRFRLTGLVGYTFFVTAIASF